MNALHEMTQMAPPQPVACPGSTQPYVCPKDLSVALLLAPAGAGRRRYEVLSTWARERNNRQEIEAAARIEARESLHEYGFWVTRGEGTWRFWCLTPSAAYWLAANLNEHMVGEAMTHGRKERNKALPASTLVGVVDAIHEEGGDAIVSNRPGPEATNAGARAGASTRAGT